jgi:hypothetical protein
MIANKQSLKGKVSSRGSVNGTANVGGAYVANIVVDDALSDTSTNPVQNRVVTGEVNEMKTQLQYVGTTIGNIDVLLGLI